MSTETIIKEDLNKPKLDPSGSGKIQSGPQISNLNLNKVYDKFENKKKNKNLYKQSARKT